MDMVDSIRRAKTTKERLRRDIERQIPVNLVENRLIMDILTDLATKVDKPEELITDIVEHVTWIASKYGDRLQTGELKVGLYIEYGTTYAGTAIERVGKLLVYGEPIDGGGAEVVDEEEEAEVEGEMEEEEE